MSYSGPVGSGSRAPITRLRKNMDVNERFEAFAANAVARRHLEPKLAQPLARKALYHAAMMVKAGDTDAMAVGVANPIRRSP